MNLTRRRRRRRKDSDREMMQRVFRNMVTAVGEIEDQKNLMSVDVIRVSTFRGEQTVCRYDKTTAADLTIGRTPNLARWLSNWLAPRSKLRRCIPVSEPPSF